MALFVPIAVHGEERPASLSAAVDAQGLRHRGNEYAGLAPWMKDVLKTVAPDYSYNERAHHQTGSGLFRLALDLETGSVTQVSIVKSTGFSALDSSAVGALRRWRWKPRRWKEIDVPITFELSRYKRGMYIGSSPAWR